VKIKYQARQPNNLNNATTTMEFYYRKASLKIPNALERIKKLETNNIQNFLPIYLQFLNLTNKNYNSVVLNSRYELVNVFDDEPVDDGVSAAGTGDDETSPDPHYIVGEVIDTENAQSTNANHARIDKSIFIKYSPLLDPIKYLSGKYDVADKTLLSLPKYESSDADCHSKILDCNNSAYVDGFFTFLSSKVMHAHKLCHGIEYYGAYVAYKHNFEVNITDDLDIFQECGFFKTNRGILYDMDSTSSRLYEESLQYRYGDEDHPNHNRNHNRNNLSGRAYKTKLAFSQSLSNDDGVVIVPDTVDDALHTLFDANHNTIMPAVAITELVAEAVPSTASHRALSSAHNSRSSTPSSNSSRSSDSTGTCNDDDTLADANNDSNDNNGRDELNARDNADNGCDELNARDNADNGDSESESEGDDCGDIYAQIKKFPVNMVLMEECADTLDSLMEDGAIETADEWGSALMQIIMTLVAYQKMFWFTHNDLHTNNVMFVETDKEYLFYLYGGKHYRVPTFGKIFKIIDFGRAAYKFKTLTICSDSFHQKGDAATQYNFEPYMNDKKPRLEPNPSFDLCRLACSLYDYFIHDVSRASELSSANPIIALIADWVNDDKGRNVLYKSNGAERYPDFKLYKMIARTVHRHVPSAQLSNPLFSKYEFVGQISQKNKQNMMRIDEMPAYYV
jgi:hypothetical protein